MWAVDPTPDASRIISGVALRHRAATGARRRFYRSANGDVYSLCLSRAGHQVPDGIFTGVRPLERIPAQALNRKTCGFRTGVKVGVGLMSFKKWHLRARAVVSSAAAGDRRNKCRSRYGHFGIVMRA